MAAIKYKRVGETQTQTQTAQPAAQRQTVTQQQPTAVQRQTQPTTTVKTQSTVTAQPTTQTTQSQTSYNPYYDVNAIYNQKGLYNERRYAGTQGDYNAAAQAAVQYYDSLRNNGYSSVADELSKSSQEKALEILGRYSPTAQTASTTPTTTTNYGQNAAAYLNSIMPSLAPSQATENAISGANTYANQLLNLYQSGVNQTAAQSQQLQGTIYKYIGDQSSRYDNLNNYNLNTNPYTTATGQSILSNYGVQGDNAMRDAAATVAGDNGGNIDSYAAANAKRQQLAFTNAGHEAVRNDFNSRVANSLSILQSLGVDVGNAFNTVQDNISSNINQNANTLAGAGDAFATATNAALTADQTRANAATQILSDFSNLAQAELSAAVTREGYISQESIANITADLERELTQMGIDAETAAQVTAAVAEAELQKLVNEGIATEATAKMYVADQSRDATIGAALTDADARKYVADQSRDATTGAAEIKGNYDLQTQQDKSASDIYQYLISIDTNETSDNNPTYRAVKDMFIDHLSNTPSAEYDDPVRAFDDRVDRVCADMLSNSVFGRFEKHINHIAAELKRKGTAALNTDEQQSASDSISSAFNNASGGPY